MAVNMLSDQKSSMELQESYQRAETARLTFESLRDELHIEAHGC
jgi:hypothetical protein